MAPRSIFPEAIQNFILANYKGITYLELADKVNAAFGTSYTAQQIKNYRNNHCLRQEDEKYLRKFSEPVKAYILANHYDFGYRVMTKKVNAAFGTTFTPPEIKRFYQKQGLHVCAEARLRNSHNAPNSHIFKKGHLPATTKPLGHEVANTGYVYVKIRERPCRPRGKDHFQLKHHLVWEQAHGPVPEGSILIFLDGDKNNCSLENLQLVTRAENTTMLNHHLRYANPALTKSGALVAKVIMSAKEKEKNLKQEET